MKGGGVMGISDGEDDAMSKQQLDIVVQWR